MSYSTLLRTELRGLGAKVPIGIGPIVAVVIGESDKTMKISTQLRELGVFIQGIRPPTVPTGTGRLRIVATAGHSPEQIERVLGALRQVLR
jgi:7-keto-8-aminopelargonate synthetase-like enzyme